jgi:CheY-like chemotaxis protein
MRGRGPRPIRLNRPGDAIEVEAEPKTRYFVRRMADEQRNGMKGEESRSSEEMLSRLGHELGNCLAPIRNALRLMEHQNVDARTVDYARGVIQQQLVELEKLSRRLMGGATAPAAGERTEKGRRILIADDNRAWVDSLASVLRNEGYTVYAAYGGREAVQMATELHPDVVLLDIEMPEMSGYETARRMRAQLPEHPMQIIAITVWGRESDRAAARLAGFNHHLTKPLLFDQLVKVLPH